MYYNIERKETQREYALISLSIENVKTKKEKEKEKEKELDDIREVWKKKWGMLRAKSSCTSQFQFTS